jgi:hypothetical protein
MTPKIIFMSSVFLKYHKIFQYSSTWALEEGERSVYSWPAYIQPVLEAFPTDLELIFKIDISQDGYWKKIEECSYSVW